VHLILALLALALAAAPVEAAPLRFQVLPEASELGFHATSRLANADGRFARFDGEVLADPADLSTARVSMKVEAASIDTGIRRRDNHLRSEDFLHVDRFPRHHVREHAAGEERAAPGPDGPAHLRRDEGDRGSNGGDRDGNRLEARTADINRGDYGINYDSSPNPISARPHPVRFCAQAVR
jgi:polyisoprenoid-binding protein YceI